MRTRVTILLLAPVVALLSLTACSSDDEPESPGASRLGTPSATLTEITVPCAEFQDTAEKIAQAQAALYGGSGDAGTIETLVAALDELKDGAPADVQDALDTLADGFRDAQALLTDPEAADQEKFAGLAEELSAAGQKVTTYVVDRCR